MEACMKIDTMLAARSLVEIADNARFTRSHLFLLSTADRSGARALGKDRRRVQG
jgi:hypothetical protein